MKLLWLAALATTLVICTPMTAMAGPPTPAAAAADTPADKIPSVGVDSLMAAPDNFKGTVRVRGVVNSVFPKEQRLGLIDAVYLNCCASPCGTPPPVLPVTWAGGMPPMKTLVLVTGDIRRTGPKMEFVARSVEAIRPDTTATK